ARVDALSQDLADALASELEVDAIGGLEVRRQLPPDGLPPDCVANPKCTADVAARLGVSQLLFVVMVNSGTGGSVQVDPTWLGLQTRSKYNDCDKLGLDCPQDTRDSIRRRGLVADSGFAIAAIAAGITVALFSTSATEAHLVVAPTPEGGAAVSAFGSF